MVKKAEPEQTNNPSAQRSVETSGIRASIILEALCPLKNNVFAMGVGIPDQAEDIQVYFEDEKLSKYLTVGDLVEDLSGQEIAADTVVLVHSPAGAGDASEAIGQFIGKSIQKIAESDMISFGTDFVAGRNRVP